MRYKCTKCKKEVKQLNFDKEAKEWKCNDCFYDKIDNHGKTK